MGTLTGRSVDDSACERAGCDPEPNARAPSHRYLAAPRDDSPAGKRRRLGPAPAPVPPGAEPASAVLNGWLRRAAVACPVLRFANSCARRARPGAFRLGRLRSNTHAWINSARTRRFRRRPPIVASGRRSRRGLPHSQYLGARPRPLIVERASGPGSHRRGRGIVAPGQATIFRGGGRCRVAPGYLKERPARVGWPARGASMPPSIVTMVGCERECTAGGRARCRRTLMLRRAWRATPCSRATGSPCTRHRPASRPPSRHPRPSGSICHRMWRTSSSSHSWPT